MSFDPACTAEVETLARRLSQRVVRAGRALNTLDKVELAGD